MLCLLLLLPADAAPAKPDRDAMIAGARKVAAAVVASAKANAARPRPLRGDAATEHYLQAAAAAAAKLDKEQARAFLLGVGVVLDSSTSLRGNLLTRATWRAVESDQERAARLKAVGEPTMHGRHDLAQHFAVSAALTAVAGETAAEAAGLLKELHDANPGGSGFSFADLAADYSGVALAASLIGKPKRLAELTKSSRIADLCVAPKGLAEGLSRKAFDEAYGGTDDARFTKEVAALRAKVKALAWHKGAK